MNKLRYHRLRGITSPVGYTSERHGTSMTAALRASLYAPLKNEFASDLFQVAVCGGLQHAPTDVIARVPPAHSALTVVNARGNALRKHMQLMHGSQRKSLQLKHSQLQTMIEKAMLSPCGAFADEEEVDGPRSTKLRDAYTYGQTRPVAMATTELLDSMDKGHRADMLSRANTQDPDTVYEVIAGLAFHRDAQTCTKASFLCCRANDQRNPYNSTSAVWWPAQPELDTTDYEPFEVPEYMHAHDALVRARINFNDPADAREAWLPKTPHMFALSASAYCTSQN